MTACTRILALALIVAVCSAFAPVHKAAGSKTSLNAAAQKLPKFDGEKWVYTSPDQEPSAGYVSATTISGGKCIGKYNIQDSYISSFILLS